MAAPAAIPASPRLALAQAARDAAEAHDGVLALEAGTPPACLTVSGTARVDGVSVVADGEDGYAVLLCVVAGLVPLHALADGLRAAVADAAQAAGLGATVRRVDVRVVGVEAREVA